MQMILRQPLNIITIRRKAIIKILPNEYTFINTAIYASKNKKLKKRKIRLHKNNFKNINTKMKQRN